METTITLNGKDHKFRISAATTYVYRQQFGKDLLREFQRISKNTKKDELPDSAVDVMSEVAYIAAKQADKTIPDIEEWMDQFDLMDFYQIVLPEVFKLWQKTNATTVHPKK